MKNNNNPDHFIIIEVMVGLAAFAFLVYTMRSMLIFGETTLTHDNYYWYYPVFQFFAESIINGQYPLWNPFTHSGEPFYPLLFQFKLLDPLTLLIIFFGQFITGDIVMLFNWNRLLQSVFLVFGVYIVFRPLARHHVIRLTLIPILLYSSIMLGSFRQDAIMNHFSWVPFITYFLMRIIYYRDYRWINWLALSGFIGLNWQSYFFAGTWIFFLFLITGLLLFRRDLLSDLIRCSGFRTKFMVTSIMIILMMAPNIGVMFEKDNFIYPARMIQADYNDSSPLGGPQQFVGNSLPDDTGIVMPYKLIAFTGTFSNIWDYIQIIAPDGNPHIQYPGKISWGKASEAYMYFGTLPWFIALLGMVAGRHDLKKVWTVITIGFGLLMLGPAGGLHQVLYYIYPPMWFVRHTHALVLFLMFCLLYFYVIGCNHIYCTWKMPIFGTTAGSARKGFLSHIVKDDVLRSFIAHAIFSVCIILLTYQMTLLNGHANSNILILPYMSLIFIAGWMLLRDLGKQGLYVSIAAGHIGLILFFTTNKLYFITYIILALGIPFGSFIFLKRSIIPSKTSRYYLTVLVTIISVISLCGDLIFSLQQSGFLYAREKHPAIAMNIDTSPQEPIFFEKRGITPEEKIANTSQSMRYLSLVYRQPYVFSSLMTHPESNGLEMLPEEIVRLDNDSFEYALKSRKWNSFIIPLQCFNLTSSGISPPVLEEMFAVEKPMFQFKKGVLTVEDDQLSVFLNKLGTAKSLQLLDEYVFVENETGHYPEGLIASKIKYEQAAQAISDKKIDNKFSYTINDYNYSSFKLNITAEKSGVLYWADGYDKWWRAYLNGKEVPIYRANVNFKAIALPEGDSEVRFSYFPVIFIVSLIIFYGVFIISMTSAVIIFIRHHYFSQNTV